MIERETQRALFFMMARHIELLTVLLDEGSISKEAVIPIVGMLSIATKVWGPNCPEVVAGISDDLDILGAMAGISKN